MYLYRTQVDEGFFFLIKKLENKKFICSKKAVFIRAGVFCKSEPIFGWGGRKEGPFVILIILRIWMGGVLYPNGGNLTQITTRIFINKQSNQQSLYFWRSSSQTQQSLVGGFLNSSNTKRNNTISYPS